MNLYFLDKDKTKMLQCKDIHIYVDTEEVQQRIIVMKVMIPISDKDNCILG